MLPQFTFFGPASFKKSNVLCVLHNIRSLLMMRENKINDSTEGVINDVSFVVDSDWLCFCVVSTTTTKKKKKIFVWTTTTTTTQQHKTCGNDNVFTLIINKFDRHFPQKVKKKNNTTHHLYYITPTLHTPSLSSSVIIIMSDLIPIIRCEELGLEPGSFPCDASVIESVSMGIACGGVALLFTWFLMKKVRNERMPFPCFRVAFASV